MTILRWYDALTLDHTVCRICFAAGQRTSMAEIARLEGRPLKGDRMRHRREYITSLRAAFRRHVTAAHPEWADRIGWRKD